MAKREVFNFGDFVRHEIKGSHGGDVGFGYVIGEHHLSRGQRILVVATATAHGMPINAAHLKMEAAAIDNLGQSIGAQNLRDRYERLYPGHLRQDAVTDEWLHLPEGQNHR